MMPHSHDDLFALADTPEYRADLLAFTLQSIASDLAVLRALVDRASQVQDVFPLWSDTRELETQLSTIRNDAARAVNRFMEMP